MVTKKTISKKAISLLVLLPILTFIVLRLWQGFGYLESYFNQVFQIILYKRTESYEKKQFQTMGLRYLYPKKMTDVTPENSTICFMEVNDKLDPKVDAYFLYPRVVKTVDSKNVFPIDQIRDLKCNYLVMNDSHPDFDVKVKRIIMFGQGLEDTPVVITPGVYIHNNPLYQNKTGLLEL